MLLAGALGCSPSGSVASDTGRVDLAAVIDAHVADMTPDGSYRHPRASERDTARKAVRRILDDPGAREQPDKLLSGLGFQVTHGVDTADGRRFSLYLADPAVSWGGLLIDPSQPIRSMVSVPHPAHDLNTENLGLDLYRSRPGTALLVAGAHRRASDGRADVAHHERSLFHVISEEFMERDVPQLQLHGFAERSLPGADVVVSTGSGPRNDLAVRIAREMKAVNWRVCRGWVSRCVGLEGTENVQGTAAAAAGADFVHLELGWPLRRDRAARELVRDAIVAAWSD